MKKVLFLLLPLCFAACEEIPPVISPVEESTDCALADAALVAGQQRNVLIEEFTGVRCVNCPAGAEAIDNLLAIHGERLVAISIHAGFFSQPYPDGFDFRTEDGNLLLAFLGEPLGYPTAVVDRSLFAGEDDLQLGQSQWSGFVEQSLNQPLLARLYVAPAFDPATRELDVDVSIFIESAIEAEEVHLTVALVEDGVVDKQLTPAGEQDDYVHKHVLRDIITSFDGNLLTEELSPGLELCKSYGAVLPEEWAANNCKVVAFLSEGGAQKDVLQVVETKVLP